MIDLAHEQMLPFRLLLTFFFASLALCNVLCGPDHVDGASFASDALEMNKPMRLHPADLPILAAVPELGGIWLRISGVERRFDVCTDPSHVVRMHPFRELFGVCLILGNAEHFLQACIPPDEAPDWIVLPPPEQS